MTPARGRDLDGAYWLRETGPNLPVGVAYTGAVAHEGSRRSG